MENFNFKLNETTLEAIHKYTGLEAETIQSMSPSVIDKCIENKIEE